MLVIRKAQKEALDAAMRERFLRRAAEHLRQIFPEETRARDEAALRAFIETGIARARAYGITGQQEVVLFLDLMMGLGPDFDQRPENAWAAEILSRKDLGQRERMAALCQRLQARTPQPREDAVPGGVGP